MADEIDYSLPVAHRFKNANNQADWFKTTFEFVLNCHGHVKTVEGKSNNGSEKRTKKS